LRVLLLEKMSPWSPWLCRIHPRVPLSIPLEPPISVAYYGTHRDTVASPRLGDARKFTPILRPHDLDFTLDAD
jgi:hypothetical protein